MQPTLTLRDLQGSTGATPQAEAPAATSNPAAGTSAPGAPQQPAATPFGGLTSFLPLIAIFAVFYFVLIGPERKNRKKREEMLKQLSKGDEVLTTSGMYATVAAIQNDEVTLQISDNVRARFTRAAIQTVLSDKKLVDTKDKKS
jgi:preprotein translocase subunit YajC